MEKRYFKFICVEDYIEYTMVVCSTSRLDAFEELERRGFKSISLDGIVENPGPHSDGCWVLSKKRMGDIVDTSLQDLVSTIIKFPEIEEPLRSMSSSAKFNLSILSDGAVLLVHPNLNIQVSKEALSEYKELVARLSTE